MATIKYKDPTTNQWVEIPVGGGSGGGVQFVELFPGSTLTPDQLTILKANKGNQIIYYGGVLYYFKLAYEKSSNEWLYVTFYDSAVTLTVNMTTGSATFDSGGKLYMHLVFVLDQRDQTGIAMPFYTSSNTEFTPSTFKDYFRQYYYYHGVTGKGNHMNDNYPSYAYVDKYGGAEHDNDVITYYKIVDNTGSEVTLVLSEFNNSYGSFSDTVTEV